MKLSSLLVSAPLVALLVTLLGAPALAAFAFSTAAFILAMANDDGVRLVDYTAPLAHPRPPIEIAACSRRARLPLAA